MTGQRLANVALAAASLLLAGLTTFFHLNHPADRAGQPVANTPVLPADSTRPPHSATSRLETDGAGSLVETPQRDSAPIRAEANINAEMQLARLEDAGHQARQMQTRRRGYLGDWFWHRQFIELETGEIEQLADMQAAAWLQDLRAQLACEADPSCKSDGIGPGSLHLSDAQLDQVVGTERRQQIRAVLAAEDERRELMLFMITPPGAPVTVTEARQLLLAYADEHQRMEKEAARNGVELEAFSDGPTYLPLRIDSPPSSDDRRKLAAATAYNARILQEASQILSGPALERFRAMQEAALDGYRRHLEEAQVRAGAIRGASAAGAGD